MVLAGNDHEVRLVEVGQTDRALAHSYRAVERHAGGLVAHVGAVREVVGAIGAGQQLKEICLFIGGPSRGVEDGIVWRTE